MLMIKTIGNVLNVSSDDGKEDDSNAISWHSLRMFKMSSLGLSFFNSLIIISIHNFLVLYVSDKL